MERKEFLKRSLSVLGIATVAPLMSACSKDTVDPTTTGTTTNQGSTNGTTGSTCDVHPPKPKGLSPPKLPAHWC